MKFIISDYRVVRLRDSSSAEGADRGFPLACWARTDTGSKIRI